MAPPGRGRPPRRGSEGLTGSIARRWARRRPRRPVPRIPVPGSGERLAGSQSAGHSPLSPAPRPPPPARCAPPCSLLLPQRRRDETRPLPRRGQIQVCRGRARAVPTTMAVDARARRPSRPRAQRTRLCRRCPQHRPAAPATAVASASPQLLDAQSQDTVCPLIRQPCSTRVGGRGGWAAPRGASQTRHPWLGGPATGLSRLQVPRGRGQVTGLSARAGDRVSGSRPSRG